MLWGDEANAGPPSTRPLRGLAQGRLSIRGLNRFAAQKSRGESVRSLRMTNLPGNLRDEQHLSLRVTVFRQILGFAGFFQVKRLCDGDGEFAAGDVVS